MKKSAFIFVLLLCSYFIRSQSPFTFVVNSVGAGAITCNTPFVSLYATSSYSAPATYSWIGTSGTYTGSVVQVTTAGTYTVIGYVSPSVTYSTLVQIPSYTTAPTSTLAPLTQTISCGLPSVITITATCSSSTPKHVFLSPYGGSVIVQSNTAFYTPTAPGTYTYIAEDNGCGVQKTFTVFATPSFPTFSLVSAENFSLGCGTRSVATVTLSQASSVPPNGQLSYTITSSNVYLPGMATTYSFTTPGSYTAVVRDMTNSCETKVRFNIIQNNTVPAPILVPIGGASPMNCSQPYTKLAAIQGAAGNFTCVWMQPSQAAHPYDTLTAFPSAAVSSSINGTYTVVTTDLNSLCSNTQTLTLYQNLFAPKAVISSLNGNVLTCSNDSLRLVNSSASTIPSGLPHPQPVVAETWMGPVPQVSLSLSTTYTALVAGMYTLTVIDLNNGCRSTTTTLISDSRVLPQISPLPLIDLCGQTSVIISPSVNAQPGGALSYMWIAPAGATISAPSGQNLTTNAAGVYTLFVTSQSTSCTAVSEFTVGICVGLSKTAGDKDMLSVYPNPLRDHITVEAKQQERIELYDATGRLVLDAELDKGKNELSLGSLPQGIYFLRSQSTVVKLVKTE